MAINSGQLRAARAFLRWTAQELADAARLGVATVRRAEAQDGLLGVTTVNEEAIRSALEAAGIEFLDGDAPGVKLHSMTQSAP